MTSSADLAETKSSTWTISVSWMLDGPPLRMLKTGENDNIGGEEVTGEEIGTDRTPGKEFTALVSSLPHVTVSDHSILEATQRFIKAPWV